jgi:hypothetical protein
MKKYMTIIAMLAVAAFGLSLFAQEKPAPPAKPGQPDVQAPLARVKDALNITPEQEIKIKEFNKNRAEAGKAFAEQMKKVRQDMQALRKDGQADPAKLNDLIDQSFKLRADQAKAGFKNAEVWKKIFTQEQLDKMKNVRSRQGRMGLMGGGMSQGQMMRGHGRMMRGQGRMMRDRGMTMRGRGMGMQMGMGMRMGMGQRFLGMPGMREMRRPGMRMKRPMDPGRGRGMMIPDKK